MLDLTVTGRSFYKHKNDNRFCCCYKAGLEPLLPKLDVEDPNPAADAVDPKPPEDV